MTITILASFLKETEKEDMRVLKGKKRWKAIGSGEKIRRLLVYRVRSCFEKF